MKKILLFLLFPFLLLAQNPTNFPYGIKNTSSTSDSSPAYFITSQTDGVHKKTPAATIAKTAELLKKQFLSTGLIKNGLISINSDNTKYNISAGIGVITNFDDPENPTSTIVNFPAVTAKTPDYLTTGNITYVAINGSGAVVEQATPFTTTQRRDLILLGAVIHSNFTNINVVNNISAPTNADTNQLHDFIEAVGALNVSGNKYSANGANLSLNKSAGSIFKFGSNFANDWKKPHEISQIAQTLFSFRYRLSNGTEGSDVTVLNPSVYESGGVLVSVPSNKFSIQTVTLFQTGLTRVQYGQEVYNTMEEAQAAIFTRNYVPEANIQLNGITRAYVILKNTATSLLNAADTKIIESQKFGGVASGGVALTFANIIAALGFTPENVANKSDSYTVSSSTTYASTKAIVDGLATKQNTLTNPITGTGTANTISKWTGTSTQGNSSITDNGSTVAISTNATINGLNIGVGTGAGVANTHFGLGAGMSQTTAGNNTFIGFNSGNAVTTSSTLTGLGVNTFRFIVTGSDSSVAAGYNAGRYISDGVTNLTSITSSVLIGSSARPLGNSQANQTVIGYNATGLGSNTTVLGNSSTVQTWLGGRLTIGSTIDDGSSTFQLTGAAKLNTAPTTSAGTYDILTRNSSTGVVEKKLNADFVHTTGNEIISGIKSFSSGKINILDLSFSQYASINVDDEVFILKNRSDVNQFSINPNGFSSYKSAIISANFTNSILTTNRTYTLPNASGTIALAETIKPYKVYTALLSQSGTSAPVATVLENTLGGTVVWTRSSTGIYLATLSGVFTTNKTFISMNTGHAVNGFEGASWVDTSNIQVVSYTSTPAPAYTDGRLSNNGASLEIRVYN